MTLKTSDELHRSEQTIKRSPTIFTPGQIEKVVFDYIRRPEISKSVVNNEIRTKQIKIKHTTALEVNGQNRI